jgi:dTDP-glucose 4,6-dehydratase
LTVYGDGSQTRSFCYVDDLIRGLVAMIDSHETGPINIGNPSERTVASLAELVIAISGSNSEIEYFPLPQDDPTRRRPDIELALKQLSWTPCVAILEGLKRTVEWFASRPEEVREAAAALRGGQTSEKTAVARQFVRPAA